MRWLFYVGLIVASLALVVGSLFVITIGISEHNLMITAVGFFMEMLPLGLTVVPDSWMP